MAKHLIENVFNRGRIIINFDECYFKDNTTKAYSYAFKGKRNARTYKKTIASINLFLCVIEDGNTIYQITTGNSNEVTFSSWICNMTSTLDKKRPGWRKTDVVVLGDEIVAQR